MNNSLSKTLRTLLGFACLVVVMAGLREAAPTFNRLALALIIALISLPLIRWLKGKGASNAIALVVTILTILLTLILFIGFMVQGISSLAGAIPSYAADMEKVQSTIESSLTARGLDGSGIISLLSGPTAIKELLDLALSSLVGFVGNLANMVITLLIVVFLLIDLMGIPRKLAEFIPAGNTWLSRAGAYGANVQKYLIITGIIGLGIGALNTILLLILGVDFPVLWGVLSFLLNFVPMIGYWIALIPPMILGGLESGVLVGAAVFFGYWLINGSAENFLKPKLMGDSLNLSPATVFLSVFLWSALLGPLGALLGVPLTLAVKELILEIDDSTLWMARLMSSGGKEKEDPEVVTGTSGKNKTM